MSLIASLTCRDNTERLSDEMEETAHSWSKKIKPGCRPTMSQIRALVREMIRMHEEKKETTP